MSPIECIKNGILKADWSIVCDGYKQLTGDIIVPPCITNIVDALKRINEISNIVLTESITDKPNSKLKKKVNKKSQKKINKKNIDKNYEINVNGEDTSIVLDESDKTPVSKQIDGVRLITNNPDEEEIRKNKIKAENARENKLKIRRQIACMYTVKCNECQEEFQSTRPSGKMGQKCGKCLSVAKSRFV